MQYSWRAAAALIILTAVVSAGCGSGDDKKDSSAAATAGPPIDSCALLSDADLTPVIGQHGPGQVVSADATAPVCQWNGPTASVMLTIGVRGTITNGQLPPAPAGVDTKPGPDGMRFAMPGYVEFIVGSRLNNIGLTKQGSAPADLNNAAASLARVVAGKLPK